MKKLFFLPALLFCIHTTAQQVRPATSAQVYHEIAQLENLTNVLYFAAHPDDENTRLLAWLVNDQHIRTAYLSLTRGDGGQNILGNEQGAALGLIRTHELLEARKLDGAEQFFTRAIDFGFSKNYQETFKHWDEGILTNDAVWVIRKFRPDVIICRFPPNEQAGHGQHAASAIIAAKAFKAAGDKTQYPWQLAYYKAWQPKRIVWNTYRFGSANTTSEDQFKLPVGQYSPLLGMGYGELAGISRSIHKSQGAGTPSTPGVQTEYFKYVDGEPVQASLFDGIDITWGRVDRPEIGDAIAKILKQYDFKHPENSLTALLQLRKQIATVKNKYWRTEKLAEIDQVILHCTGLLAEVYTKQPEATAGSMLPFTLHVISRSGGVPVTVNSVKWLNDDATVHMNLKNDSLVTIEHNITIPSTTPYTEPYWLAQQSPDGYHFAIPDSMLLGYPEAPNMLNAILNLQIGDETFNVPVPLSYKKLDPTRGDMVEQLRIVPPVSLEFADPLLVVQPDGFVHTAVRIHSRADIKNGVLNISGMSNNNKRIGKINITKGMDTVVPVNFVVEELSGGSGSDFYLAASLFASDGKIYSRSQHTIQYEHIPTLQYFTNAYTKVLRRNWKTTAKRIGYIEGAGDYTASILRLAGLQVDILKDGDIEANKLKKYDAVLTGIRAVNTEKRMATWMPELLRYVHNGGTLVMQYNTLQDLATTDIGPYPITLSTLRVTEEDAPVEFLNPKHRLLNYPNVITQDDFKGWVQERGLYYASKWDDRYEPIFQMHDTGEQPLKGSTLYAHYGKGHYVYAPLSFFRQLPAGNKGAIRLLLNMLSVGK